MKIRSIFRDHFTKTNKIVSELYNHSKKADDIYSLNIIQSLLTNSPYLPLNGGALRPYGLAYILNEIIINQRKNILEFGSGLSTILMARLIKKNNLSTRIISFEHNANWASILNGYLENENLESYVKVINANLKDIDTVLGIVKWYDSELFFKSINTIKFDLIIIDGPPANSMDIQYSRLPAFLNLDKNLAENYCIILDDMHREGEKKVAEVYIDLNPNLQLQILSESLGVFRNGNLFNPIPLHY